MLSCAHVFALPTVLKRDEIAASGRCVISAIRSVRDADAVLRANSIFTDGATPPERAALASGLAHATALAGGRLEFLRDVDFTFSARKGYSRYSGLKRGRHKISMNRCDSKGNRCGPNNVAHLMHELGHRVGHATSPGGGEKMYAAYGRLGVSCHLTSYSRHNKNEEFAESFAAFLTRPELLSGGDAACRRVYSFFARDVFRVNGDLASCASGAKRQLLARYEQVAATVVAGLSSGSED